MKNIFCFLFITLSFISVSSKAQSLYLFYPPLSAGVGAAATVHQDEIKLTSAQAGIGRSVSTPSAGGVRTPTLASLSEYTITKQFDRSSVKIMQSATNGGASTNNFEIRYYSGNTVVYKIELANVIITAYSATSDGEGCSSCPSVGESFGLSFSKIRATDMTAVPSIVYMWNLGTNTASF